MERSRGDETGRRKALTLKEKQIIGEDVVNKVKSFDENAEKLIKGVASKL